MPRPPLLVTILALAVCSLRAADVTVPLGDFEVYDEGWYIGLGPEFPGAQGSAGIDSTFAAKQGKSSLRLAVDFTNGGGYVQIARRFDDLPLRLLNGWLHSEGITEIRYRAVDSTGQTFQSRHFPVPQGKSWYKLSIGIEEMCRDEHWGGANDGVWHSPMKTLAIMVSANRLPPERKDGAIWFDGLSAVLEAGAKAPPAPLPAKLVDIDGGEHGTTDWQFIPGSEFPGATGEVSSDTQAKDGKRCVRLDADFNGGGSYVATHLKLDDKPVDVCELRLWVKSSNLEVLGIRLIDGTGQCHQGNHRALRRDDKWHETVFHVAEIAGGEHWGGANDGVWHPPLKGVSFVIPANRVGGGKKASVWFDDLRGVVLGNPAEKKKR